MITRLQSLAAKHDVERTVFVYQREIWKARRNDAMPLVLAGPNQRFFHCQCSDRFQTAPPHAAIVKRQLVAVIVIE